jgi:hypothetical protein
MSAVDRPDPMLTDHPIFVVFLVAVLAPLIAQTRLGSRMPVVVFEVVFGIVVVVTSLGLKSGHLAPDVAQALIGAALLSLLIYPTATRALLARAQGRTDGAVAGSGQV